MSAAERLGVGIVAPGSWEAGPSIEEFQTGLEELGVSSRIFNAYGEDKRHIGLRQAINRKQLMLDDGTTSQMNGLVVINYSHSIQQELQADREVRLAVEISALRQFQMFLSGTVMMGGLGLRALDPRPEPIVFGTEEAGADLTIIKDNLQLVEAGVA